jgi:antitoxin VapB
MVNAHLSDYGLQGRRRTEQLFERWVDVDILWHMPASKKTGKRHVRLFKNGRSQAVRIPREFELPGKDAVMHKEGRRLIIEPAAPASLLAVLAALKPIKEKFAEIEDVPSEQLELE